MGKVTDVRGDGDGDGDGEGNWTRLEVTGILPVCFVRV